MILGEARVVALAACSAIGALACGGAALTIALPHAGADVSVPFTAHGPHGDVGEVLYINTQEELRGGEFVLHQVAFDGVCQEEIDYPVRVLDVPEEERREPWLRFQPTDMGRYAFLPRFHDRDRRDALSPVRELVINDVVAADRRRLSPGCPRPGDVDEIRTSFSVPFDEGHCCRVRSMAADVCARTFARSFERYRACVGDVFEVLHCASACG